MLYSIAYVFSWVIKKLTVWAGIFGVSFYKVEVEGGGKNRSFNKEKIEIR